MEFNTKTPKLPNQLVWCGVDSIVLGYEGWLFMVGPAGEWINHRVEGSFHLVAERDGVRIVTNTVCEFLQVWLLILI